MLKAKSESVDTSHTHFALGSCCCPPSGHGGGYNSAPRRSWELGPGFSSPRCRRASNGHESGVKLTLSTAPYIGGLSCCGWATRHVFWGKIIWAVLGLRLLFLGVLIRSPLHIWIVPQTALGSGFVCITKLTHSARSSVGSTVRSLDLTVDLKLI